MNAKLKQIEDKWKGDKPHKGTTDYLYYKLDRMMYREIKRNETKND